MAVPRSRWRTIALIACLVLMVGAGTPGARADDLTPDGLCAALTPDEAGAALGAEVGPGSLTDTTCVWTTPDMTAGVFIRLDSAPLASFQGEGDEALTVGGRPAWFQPPAFQPESLAIGLDQGVLLVAGINADGSGLGRDGLVRLGELIVPRAGSLPTVPDVDASPGGPGTDAPGSPCDLVTLDEATAALDLGEDVVSAESQGSECAYSTAAGSVFSLTHWPADGSGAGSGTSTPDQQVVIDYEQAIAGLGDRAFLTPGGLFAWVGEDAIRAAAAPAVFEDRPEYEERMARLALAHLGWQQTPPSPVAAWADATCDLLSTDEVAAAVGIAIPFGEPAPIETGRGLGACAYYDDNGAQIMVLEFASSPSHVAVFDQIKAQPPDVGIISAPVPGIGDDAFAVTLEGDPSSGLPDSVMLHVRSGESIVVLSLETDAPADEQLQEVVGLAGTVLGRLGSAAPTPSGEPGGDDTGGQGICALLDSEAVSMLMGGLPIIAVESADDYAQPVCEWGSPPNASEQVQAVRIVHMNAAPGDCTGLPPLEGVGAQACMFSSDHVPPTVYALSQGGVWLEVKSAELPPEALQELAAQAVSRADEVLVH